MRFLTMLLALLLVRAASASCPDGRYLMDPSDAPVGASPTDPVPTDVVVIDGGRIYVELITKPIPLKAKVLKTGETRVKAAWKKNVGGPAKLSAKISSDCSAMYGTFAAKSVAAPRAPFAAARSFCGDGWQDFMAGELSCDPGDPLFSNCLFGMYCNEHCQCCNSAGCAGDPL